MTVSRADLERLTPDGITRYLEIAGWLPTENLNERAAIWEDGHGLQVIVPTSMRLRDYPQRVYEVVRTLATAEGRPESEVVQSISDPFFGQRAIEEILREDIGPLVDAFERLPSAAITTPDRTTSPRHVDRHVDRQRFRLFPSTPSGTISAADAAEAFQGIRELFIAAAYTERHPDAHFVLPSSKPRAVMEFPEKALLSTGPGSFVINARVPLPHEGTLLPLEETFERRVLLRLRRALLSARSAAQEAAESAELTPFADRVGDGVSKTLCQALARFGGKDHQQPFEVGFGWADAAPAGVPDDPVRFEPEEMAMLAHAAEDLGRRPRTERAEMRGTVRTMERDRPDGQGWVVVRGTLTIAGVARNRQVWVPLDPDDYDRALRAHGQGLQVRLAGPLTRTGRRAELRPTEYFRVL